MNALVCFVGFLLVAGVATSKEPIVPVIEGPWWRIAGNPDLGEYTSENQEPVDFGVWQAADGTWQLWSCIRNTKCGGHTRLFHAWEGRAITDKDWTPKGIAMEARPDLGESPGGLQAPHVVLYNGKYWMAYGDWRNICFATSKDGKSFERRIQSDGTTGVFSEGEYANARDPMMIQIDGKWHCYYTAIAGNRGYAYCRISPDLETWSPSFVVSYGGSVGDGPWWNECPHVVEVEPGEFVYFRNQFYGEGNRNWVYYSENPYNFGIDNDEGLVTDLPIAAPEIVQHDGKYYIAALTPELDGIRVARLRWARKPSLGEPVFDFDDPEVRKLWTMKDADFDAVFYSKTHAPFDAVTTHVIGTCEQNAGGFDDTRTGIIESPPFVLEAEAYTLLVGGGSDEKTVYVAVIDADSGQELARFSGSNKNAVEKKTFRPGESRGKRAHIQVVDQAKGGWGHVNFGGIFKTGEPVIFK
jgi:hypothetical protein